MVVLGNDDWSGFMARFGLKGPFLKIPDGLQTIAQHLRRHIGIEARAVAELLADHLESRIDALYEQLEFISQNVGTNKQTPEEELARIQFWNVRGPLPWAGVENEFREFDAPVKQLNLLDWREEAKRIRIDETATKLELFKRFSQVEQRLEPIETMVNDVACEIDSAIQLEIDRLRGK